MAPIKVERVLSVSSEDKDHVAENIINIDQTNKKWRCKLAGEKQASVVIQLCDPSIITAIDVGNENSALIEILVGKSSTPDANFQVLLATSSLMNLKDSKSYENISNVQFYKKDDFSLTVRDQKWDRVKIVCSQPFNKYKQYGLSFINFHTYNKDETPHINTLGNFQLKTDSKDDPILKAGGLFAKKKEIASHDLSGAASIRVADNSINKIKLPKKAVIVHAESVTPTDIETHESPKVTKKVKKIAPSTSATTQEKEGTLPTKRKTAPSKQKSPKKMKIVQPTRQINEKPFNVFLNGVTFVISGYQNPLRSDLRSKALAMGAKYKADWDNSCTHLICAFRNTPKYAQVHGRGKIVKKEWIEDSYTKRIAFPWRRYALDSNELSKPISDDEIYEEGTSSQRLPIDNRRKIESSSDEDTDDEIKKVLNTNDSDSDPEAGPSWVPDFVDESSSSSDDTEDEIERVKQFRKNKEKSVDKPQNGIEETNNIYDADTEHEEDENCNELSYLSDIFDGLNFALLDDLGVDERKKLNRYITAHKGSVSKQLSSDVEYVISNSISEVEKAKQKLPSVTGVRPEWIWRAHDLNKLLPVSIYEVL